MRKILFYAVIVVVIVLLILVFWNKFNPRLFSASEIRDNLLVETPVGTHVDELRNFLDNHESWSFIQERYRDFNEINRLFQRTEWSFGDLNNYDVMLGIEAWSDAQRVDFFNESITSIIWRFDEDGRLVDIITSIRIHNRWY